ncbi:MAG: hypothetical protein ABI867_28760 [Kofleriaceae bacterium]
MSDDDRAVMERLAALEAEVKADADAQTHRKEVALAKVKEQRAKQVAERDELRDRQTAMVTKKKLVARPAPEPADVDDSDDLGGALALAKRAHGVKQELSKTPKAGEKSWVKSGVASLLLGPIGWLYAGSLREAIPATAGWLAFAALASKIIPMFLLMPVLMVVLPLSGIAGVVYAMQYNRKGSRQRLFDKKAKKQLPSG